MCDTAGQLTYRFHLLCLPKRLFSLQQFSSTLGDFPFQFLARSGQHLARRHDVLDISARTKPAGDPPFIVAHSLRTSEYPAVLASSIAQAVLDPIRLARSEAAPPRGPGPLPVVGMEHIVPGLAVRRALGHAGVVVPTLIIKIMEAVGARGPDHRIDGISDG